jgi:hypothetical protein
VPISEAITLPIGWPTIFPIYKRVDAFVSYYDSLDLVQRRLDQTLAHLAFEMGFDVDSALGRAIDDNRRDHWESMEGWDDHRTEPMLDATIEVEWRSAHSLRSLSVIETSVAMWLLGTRQEVPPALKTVVRSWADRADARAIEARELLGRRRAKHKGAQKMLAKEREVRKLDDDEDNEPVDSLSFDDAPLDPDTARIHIDRARKATTTAGVVREVASAATALGDVDYGWSKGYLEFDFIDDLLRAFGPPDEDHYLEWLTQVVEPKVASSRGRTVRQFLSAADSWAERRREQSGEGLRELAQVVASRKKLSRVLMDAVDVINRDLPSSLRLVVRSGEVDIVATDHDRITISTAREKRIRVQLILDDEPAADPLFVSLAALRTGAAKPLLDVLGTLAGS